jgi:hypothetical protein
LLTADSDVVNERGCAGEGSPPRSDLREWLYDSLGMADFAIVAGYSGTPLAAKLGIKCAMSITLLNAPDLLEMVFPDSVTISQDLNGQADVVVAFFTWLADLEAIIDELASTIFPAGALWVAWPKKASRVDTNLSDNEVRTCALQRGLVDNKVCAVNATWSALRVVWRKELRSIR